MNYPILTEVKADLEVRDRISETLTLSLFERNIIGGFDFGITTAISKFLYERQALCEELWIDVRWIAYQGYNILHHHFNASNYLVDWD